MRFAFIPGWLPDHLLDLRMTLVKHQRAVGSVVKESFENLDGYTLKVALELEPSFLETYEGRRLTVTVYLAKGFVLQFACEEKSKGAKRIIIPSPLPKGENTRGPL